MQRWMPHRFIHVRRMPESHGASSGNPGWQTEPCNREQATEVVISALVAIENSQPEVARLLLDVAAAIVQAGQVRFQNEMLLVRLVCLHSFIRLTSHLI
jgi:hypothetical protein